jgi:hypothetical protein
VNGSRLWPENWQDFARKEAIVLERYADYSTDLTDEEREMGFELIEFQPFGSESASRLQAVAYRFSEFDQIVKMNIPVIGGHSFRHERLRARGAQGEYDWIPAGAIVFPTAAQALDAIGSTSSRYQMCH